MTWPSAVINIIDEKNASISGEGTLDCRGKVFWDKYWEMRKEYVAKGLRWIVDYDCKRVRGILVERSSDITLSGFTLMRTGFWGCQILYSDYCTIDGLTINNNIGGHGPSTDGIDIDSSCNILIENCDIDCNDDNICIKSGRDADGLRVNRPTENVVVRNCTARKGAGLITCGSETSGSIRNVLGYDLKAVGTYTVLRLKSAMNRGGTIENIYMTRVSAENVRQVLAADLNWNPSYSYSTLPKEYEGKEIPEHWKVMLTPVEPPEKGYPRFRDIYLSQVKAENVDEFISASGWNDTLRLENFYLYSIEAQTNKPGKICYTRNFNLSGITLDVKDRDAIELKENEQSNIHFDYVKTTTDRRTAGNLPHYRTSAAINSSRRNLPSGNFERSRQSLAGSSGKSKRNHFPVESLAGYPWLYPRSNSRFLTAGRHLILEFRRLPSGHGYQCIQCRRTSLHLLLR
mgnify:CR=1 FL=1